MSTRNRWKSVALIGLIAAAGYAGEAAEQPAGAGGLALGSQAPAFELPDVVSGRTVSLDDFKDKPALLVAVICRHCPYVQHVKGGLAQLGKDYDGKGLGIVAISANDPARNKLDSPEGLKAMATEEGFVFPLCFDERQAVVKALGARYTPDFFLFDQQRRLVYHGQLDDSRPGNEKPVTGHDLRAAIDAVLAGEPVPAPQTPSFGCTVKWKPGNDPSR